MVPRVGQKIGPYEILGRLGSGGMGLVFSAWDGRLHRDVAIKLLKDEFLNPTMRSRFLGEARAASRLNHPNICTIFDIGEEQDCPYLVMELLKGETLRGRMQQGPIPVATIIQVATQVAEALSVAHEHGIVHRDVKPANVVLVDKPNGTFQTKVLDFGLAKVDMEGLDSRSGLTTTGMTVGTVSYMSPEQARGELLDGRSDLFALGVLMYEMATRKLPFDGATSALVFVQLLNHPPEPLRALNAGVPKALEQVINICLQKKRDDRYQNGHDLVLALQKAAQHLDVSEKPTSWLSRFASGLKRESTGQTAVESPDDFEAKPEPVSPLQMSSDEAFLRPFKPPKKPNSDSKHFEPVNEPYSPSDGGAVAESAAASNPEQTTEEADEELPVVAVNSDYRQTSESRKMSANGPAIEWFDEPGEAPPHDDVVIDEDQHFPPSPAFSNRWRIFFGCLLAAVIVTTSIAVVLSKKRAAIPKASRTILIGPIVNHAGDTGLAYAVSAGVKLSLQQSPWIGLRNAREGTDSTEGDLLHPGTPQFTAFRRKAQADGAGSFVIGEIGTEGHTYVVSLHVYDSATGIGVGECSSSAASRQRLTGAVDGLATNLRAVLGESASSISSTSLPLSTLATGNLDALITYDQASTLEAQGRFFSAAEAFERAASLGGGFVQARLRLAALYYRQHASVSASDAANQAQAVEHADEKSMLTASGLQALLATGDLPKATSFFSQLTKKFPLDETGFSYLAEVQRLQGNFEQALASAQQATSLAPASQSAIEEQQLALLTLDRPDDAIKLTQPKVGTGSPTTSAVLLARLVTGEGINLENLDSDRPEDLDLHMTEASLLDATGQDTMGLVKWRTIAQSALRNPALLSSASYALSQAALDRALAGDCSATETLTREVLENAAGEQTLFAVGLGSALCGNLGDARFRLASLTATYPQSWRVRGYYSSDLNAILQWKSGALADGLATLQSAAQYDGVSSNQFLQGQIFLAQKQPQSAAVALQASLHHVGSLVQTNAMLLPITNLTLARAFAENGDAANSTRFYARAANLLKNAEPGNRSLLEAQAGASR